MQTRWKLATTVIAVVISMLAAGARFTYAAEAKEADIKKMTEVLPKEAPAKPAKAHKVLVYGNAEGFVHSSIPLGQKTIIAIGEKTGAWTGTITNDPAAFDDLKDYDAVCLVSTTSRFLIAKGKPEEKASKDAEKQRMQNLLDFVQKDGKGLMGIHAATDAYYDNKEYGALIGGYFNNHPWHEKVGVKIDDPKSPLTSMFDKGGFDIVDEIYQFSNTGKPSQTYSREKLHVLLSLDMTAGKTAPKGNAKDNDYGVAWIQESGKGRVFYCSLGHREDIYWNATVLKFYLAGLQYALGDLKADATPSGKVPTAPATTK